MSNLYSTGVKIVDAILAGWTPRFEQGIRPDNYIGDIFGSLGGKPDFVPDDIGTGSACSANKAV
jgi:hypothetical protein